MTPKALRLIMPNGKNIHSYVFFDPVINDRLLLFKGNPFNAYTPRGWQKVTDPPADQSARSLPPVQAGRPMGQAR